MIVECEQRQLNKYGEELCGDNVEICRNSDNTVIVLSDGLGSGVKANILSTMTKKIVSTMLSNGMDIEEVVETLASTLPVCQTRQLAYSTFTIAQIFENNEVKLVEFDNPNTFYIHDSRLTAYESTQMNIAGKNIKLSKFKISQNDFLVLVSDGLVHAGIGGLVNLGWGWEKIGSFIQRNIYNDLNAHVIADKLIFAANELYDGKVGDDVTVVVVKLREKKEAAIAVGPPMSKKSDKDFCKTFIKAKGRKIICGGTTASIIAKHLKKEVQVLLQKNEMSVPPKAKIQGIELVTEGIITLSKALEILDEIKAYELKRNNIAVWNAYKTSGGKDKTDEVYENPLEKKDYIPKNPAEELALELKAADKVRIFAGQAINPAHQNPDFPMQSGLKLLLIKKLKEKLESYGKEVEIQFY